MQWSRQSAQSTDVKNTDYSKVSDKLLRAPSQPAPTAPQSAKGPYEENRGKNELDFGRDDYDADKPTLVQYLLGVGADGIHEGVQVIRDAFQRLQRSGQATSVSMMFKHWSSSLQECKSSSSSSSINANLAD